MQDSYVSLHPDQAESMTSQQRARVWSQRLQESSGGAAGAALAAQFGATTMLCSYTLMRGRGFRVTPFAASKIPGVGGIFLAGVLGSYFGSSYACASMGNSAQYKYLMLNRSAIVGGTMPLDAPKE